MARSALLRLSQHPLLNRGARSVVRSLAARANYHVVRGMADAEQRPDVDRFLDAMPWSITSDYVRQGTAQLLCADIVERKVPGAIGELGVFRGDFAYLLSGYLPDRPIHLFDTFEGFDSRDVAADARENLVDDFIDFSGTDPQSAAGAEDVTFALVSIDADLYAPVLDGLSWFYERLSPGGYILVHDFNNRAFGGAKKATREFQERSGATVVPIPDWGGTAVVARPAG